MSVQEACSGEPALVPAGLRGYRTWTTASGADRTLRGHYGHLWREGDVSAICVGRSLVHAAPHHGCTCGIYGWYKPGRLSRLMFLNAAHGSVGRVCVFGVIEATGRVLLGTSGFRAERARIVALACSDAATAAALGRLYGVPVFLTSDELLAAYPPEDVAELLGREPDEPVNPLASIGASVAAVGAALNMFGMTAVAAAEALASAVRSSQAEDVYKAAAAARAGGGTPTFVVADETEHWRSDGDRRRAALAAQRSRNTGPPLGRYRVDGKRGRR